jgi:hypothetical protein
MNEQEKEKVNTICCWIGDGEGCRHPTMYGKSYCETHHDRVYLVMPPEMADYILNKELEDE